MRMRRRTRMRRRMKMRMMMMMMNGDDGDDDGGVDAGSDEVFADGVKVCNAGGSGVANWNPEVDKTWEGLLQSLDHILQGLQILNLYFVLLLADVDILQLVGVLL